MFPKLKDPGPYSNSIRVDVFFYLPEVSICASYLPAVGSVVKNPCANAGDEGLIPGSERSPEEGNGNHSILLVWEILWTEEPGGL